jgi:hypothetical protein
MSSDFSIFYGTNFFHVLATKWQKEKRFGQKAPHGIFI